MNKSLLQKSSYYNLEEDIKPCAVVVKKKERVYAPILQNKNKNQSQGIASFIKLSSFFDLIKKIFVLMLGSFVAKKVNDASEIWKKDDLASTEKNNRFGKTTKQVVDEYNQALSRHKDSFDFNNFDLVTNDGQTLNTLEIKHSKNPEQKKYMVHFLGRGAILEKNINDFIDDAKNLDCNIVTYNYRGCYNSSGKQTNCAQMIDDAVSQVNRLIKKGVQPNNITLYGASLGGMVATHAAEKLHANGMPVRLFADRTFSSLANQASGVFRLIFKQKGFNLLGRIASNTVYPLVKSLSSLSGWETDITKAYKSIPETHKNYLIVRSSKEMRKKQPMLDDGIIDYRATIHYALKPERKREKARYKLNIIRAKKQLDCVEKSERAKKAIEKNQHRLLKFRAHKLEGFPNPDRDNLFDLLRKKKTNEIAHSLPLEKLKSRAIYKNGLECLQDFMQP